MTKTTPSSSTALVYGIIVSNESLAAAAFWFQSYKRTFLTLDWILMRKKNDTLQYIAIAQGKKNFGDLPLEIIEVIKREMVDTKLGPHRDEGECYHNRYWDSSGVRSGRCDSLLEYYGLVISPMMDWITETDGYDDYEYDWSECYSSISIPIQNPSLDSRTNYDYDGNPIYSPQLLHFDPSTIDTTEGRPRFKQLVKEWNLKVYDDSIQVMGELEEKLEVGEEKAGLEGQEDGNNLIVKKRVEKVEIEPRWMIISHTRHNYLF